MIRKRWVVVLMVATCLGVVGFAAYLRTCAMAINKEIVAKIENGMTLAEVEAILGGPARDESNALALGGYCRAEPDRSDWSIKEWISDDAAVAVWFGDDEFVTDSTEFTILRQHESYLDKVRRWLRL